MIAFSHCCHCCGCSSYFWSCCCNRILPLIYSKSTTTTATTNVTPNVAATASCRYYGVTVLLPLPLLMLLLMLLLLLLFIFREFAVSVTTPVRACWQSTSAVAAATTASAAVDANFAMVPGVADGITVVDVGVVTTMVISLVCLLVRAMILGYYQVDCYRGLFEFQLTVIFDLILDIVQMCQVNWSHLTSSYGQRQKSKALFTRCSGNTYFIHGFTALHHFIFTAFVMHRSTTIAKQLRRSNENHVTLQILSLWVPTGYHYKSNLFGFLLSLPVRV